MQAVEPQVLGGVARESLEVDLERHQPCEPGCPGAAADPNVLTVSIAESAAGPLCLTRCAICTAERRYPRLTADAARRLVIEHREHVREASR